MNKVEFPNIASEFVALTHYCRWISEENRRETWSEVIDRVIEFLKTNTEGADNIPAKVWNEIRKGMATFNVMPSMRLVATAGPVAARDNTCIFNCFSKDTKFVTSHGIKSFNEFQDGDEITVLTQKGNWKPAVVRCYDEQPLNKIYIHRGRNHFVVKATSSHRWFIHDDEESVTTTLKVGDQLLPSKNIFMDFDYDKATPFERLYWCYGYVYGDGTKIKYDCEYRYSMVRLCGNESALSYRFEEMGFLTSRPLSCGGDPFVYTETYLKTAPNPKIDSPELIRAFVHGYLAADGERNKNTSKNNRPYVSIQSSEEDHQNFIEQCFPIAGMFIHRVDNLTGQKTNFGVRGLTKKYFINNSLATTDSTRFQVEEVEHLGRECDEEVWCLEVEDDHGFVLESGIATGNCAYSPIDSWQSFGELLFILMCGTGVGFSVENDNVSKLPVIKAPTGARRDDYEVEDTREGWAMALLFGLETWANGEDVIFKTDKIRPYGSPLKTMGGRSSGPVPFVEMMKAVKEIVMNAKGRKLTSLECHDIACHIAQSAVMGGKRRSAMISFSDVEDLEMRGAKDFMKGAIPTHRYMANNSAVFKTKPPSALFMQEFSALALSGSGERGILNVSNLKKFCPGRELKGNERTNPCVVGDTLVLTTNGYIQAKNLVGHPFEAIVNGSPVVVPHGFFRTGVKEVLKIVTSRGYEISLTPNHKLLKVSYHSRKKMVQDWVDASSLRVGDEIALTDETSKVREEDPHGDERELYGWAVGLLIGDGTFGKYACLDFWGSDGRVMSAKALKFIRDTMEHRSDMTACPVGHDKLRIQSVALTRLVKMLGVRKGHKKITPEMERGSERFVTGVVRGMFDTDGSVQGNQQKGVSVRLTQIDKENLKAIQRMLIRLGIVSTIYEGRTPARKKLVPDGKGGQKEYACAEVHELIISGANLRVFQKKVGFESPSKSKKLSLLLGTYKRTLNREQFVDTIKSIEPIGKMMVYDVQIPMLNEFSANGIRAHNCGEILLRPYEFCNLTEAVVRSTDDISDLVEKVKTAAWLGVIQSTYTHFPFLRPRWARNCNEERLIGVSLTGQLDNPHILSEEVLGQLRKVAERTTKHAANKLGINPPAAYTCVKPSGTVSQVVDASPGVHPRWSKYYIRRYRIAKSDPLFRMMIDQGMPFNPENGQTKNNFTTAVFEFPTKSPMTSIFKDNWGAMEQLEWYRKVQMNWSTHNVSNTVYVKPDEWLKVGSWVYEHWEDVVGISFFPHDGGKYELAPYEEITEEKYNELMKAFPKLDFSKLGDYEKQTGDTTTVAQELACSGDQCEIK